MTFVDSNHFGSNVPVSTGRIDIYLDKLFPNLRGVGRADIVGPRAAPERTPTQQRLVEIQRAISAFSMHLPPDFAAGLGTQFANMLDDDAWEDEDYLPELSALSTFLNLLNVTNIQRRPGIGTNGRGAVTAFWLKNENRLTANCLPSGEISWVLSATSSDGARERAAGICAPSRMAAVIAPYDSGIWLA